MMISKLMCVLVILAAFNIFGVIPSTTEDPNDEYDPLKWRYTTFIGYNCPHVREQLTKRPSNWQPTPECNSDGTFKEVQCAEKPPFPYSCMCVRPDGQMVSGMRTGQKYTCVCPKLDDKITRNITLEYKGYFPQCLTSGYFAPLQCNFREGVCWCVDPEGKVLSPPSEDTKSCSTATDPSATEPPGGI